MRQLINHVECRRWHSHLPHPIRQLQNIRALQICIPFEPFLQTSIIDRIVHYAREEMQLHRHAVQRRLQMMISYIILYFKMTLGIFRYPFPTCIHPYINIPRITGIWIRIHQGIPLSFQNTASQSILSKHRIELACHHIHLHVLSPNLLCCSHPSHQQVSFYRILL